MTASKSRRAASRKRVSHSLLQQTATQVAPSLGLALPADGSGDEVYAQARLALDSILTTEERAALNAEDELQDALSHLQGLLPSLARRPDVTAEIQNVLSKAQSRYEAMATGNAFTGIGEAAGALMTFGGSPTGSTPQGSAPNGPIGIGYGGGLYPGMSEQPKGVMNTKILRRVADHDPWVNAAKRHRANQIARADIDVLPLNYDAAFSSDTQQQLRRLLESPNEYRDSWATLIAEVVEDMLVIDRGVISKNMTVKRLPVGLYCEDGATIKIYAGWDGNPKTPRYIYEQPNSTIRVPLRNDEAIVMMEGQASHRFSYSRVQVLLDVIDSDIKAMEAAARMVTDKPPPTAIVIPGANEYQLKRLRESYQSFLAGQREVMFLGSPGGGEGAPSVHSMVYSLRESQWMEWQEYLARQICAVFQVSPQSLGITMDVNRATGETQQNIEDDAGRLPLMLLIEEFLNRELVSDFAPLADDGRPDLNALNLGITFPDISEASKILHVERLLAIAEKGLAGLPFMTVNMALELMGEKPVSGGNTFYFPSQSQGPIPFLSYDGENANFSAAGALGAQGPGSGPGNEDSPAAAEAQGEGQPKTPAPPTQPSPAPAKAPAGGSGDESSGNGGVPAFAAAYLPPTSLYNPYQRRPGQRWRPSPSRSSSDQSLATPLDPYDPYLDLSYGQAEELADVIRFELLNMTSKRPQSLGRVPQSIALRHHRPLKETEARQRLQAAVKRVFSDAANRGHTTLLQAAQDMNSGAPSAPISPP